MNKTIVNMVAERILEKMKDGKIPWLMPWVTDGKCALSGATGKPYSFLNQMLLGQPGEYYTVKEMDKLGGTIKAGEKGNIVVFWKMVEKEEENEKGEMVKKTYPILRYNKVWRHSQIEGIKTKYYKTEEIEFEHDVVKEAEEVVTAYKEANPELEIKNEDRSNEAFYNRLGDYIVVPNIKQFENAEEYYSTLFHEMIHSTGHEKRLNRLEKAKFGSEKYGKEELIAEIGAASLMSMVGIETEKTLKNSTAYIENWMEAIKENPEIVITSAGKAEKAVNYIKGAA